MAKRSSKAARKQKKVVEQKNENNNDNYIDNKRIDLDDKFEFDISTSPAISRNFGAGDDLVKIRSRDVDQIRITFTSAEVGNGNPNDGSAIAPQDGGLAVRVQAENAAGNLVGPVSRFDDEGIQFKANRDALFDVRDLVTGASRGLFDEVILGTSGNDKLGDDNDDRREFHDYDDSQDDGREDNPDSYYINGGMGNDRIFGGSKNDFLVGGGGDDVLIGRQGNDTLLGGAGNDTLRGGRGNDTINGGDGNDTLRGGAGGDRFIFTGAAGNDRILDFVSGTDTIDLDAYGITAANVAVTSVNGNTVLGVNTDGIAGADFTITLVGVGAPLATDYIF